MAVYYFPPSFEINSNFGWKCCSSTNLGAEFVQNAYSHSIIVLFVPIINSRSRDLLSFLTMELYEELEICF
jgi:hypothetical protein